MTVYGKVGLRELALQNTAKAHYLAGKLKPAFTGKFFNEFVARVGNRRRSTRRCSRKRSIGGLPLGRFYPELADSMLVLRHRNDAPRRNGRVSDALRAPAAEEVLA